MPLVPSRRHRSSGRPLPRLVRTLAGLIALAPAICLAEPQATTYIRSKQIELHYRLRSQGKARVELWYTRNLGQSWQNAGADPDGVSPYVFEAPAEGLYGLKLVIRERAEDESPAPAAGETPQRWVFVDYTPPLLQWESVAAAKDRPGQRVVHLQWTGFDANLGSRPIGLSFQVSGEENWRTIDDALPNTGRYDWPVPAEVGGEVRFRLVIQDLAGHQLVRVSTPVEVGPAVAAPATRPTEVVTTQPASALVRMESPVVPSVPEALPTSRPAAGEAAVSATQPAVAGPDYVRRRKATELAGQGRWHLDRGQYAVAAERFREALELDPSSLAVRNDLAGTYYLQHDYSLAGELYNEVLKRDPKYGPALRGAALVYVARKQYAAAHDMLQRLLSDHPRDAEAWLDLGDVLFMMGRKPEALRHWQQAATVEPSAHDYVRKARQRLDLYGTGTEITRR